MNIINNKIMATLIALFLMLTITATSIFVSLPLSNAHDPPWTFPTTAYVTCAPGIIGVGQYTTIVVWLDRYSPTSGGANGQSLGWLPDKHHEARRKQHKS